MNRADTIPHQDWQIALGSDGIVAGIADIDQCIQTILGTPQGSDPHNPLFGSNIHHYLDWPQQRATAHIVREAMLAIRRWEPRAHIISTLVSHTIAAITLTVAWRPVAGGDTRSTAVGLPR